MKSRLGTVSCMTLLILITGCSGGSGGSNNNGEAEQSTSPAGQPGDSTGSDSGTGNPNPVGTPPLPDSSAGSTAAIAGFWDFSSSDGSDIVYELITDDGMITYYDYDQDADGDGLNCFYVQHDTFTAVGNNQYNFNGFVLTMVKSGDRLLVTYPGQNPASVAPVVGIDPVDLNAC